jgi:hypothetical protein
MLSSLRIAVFASLLGVHSLAMAQVVPETQPSGPPNPSVGASESSSITIEDPEGGPPAKGFQIQGRMSTNVGLSSILSPGFSLGYRAGKVVIAAELGMTAGKVKEGAIDVQAGNFITFTPMVAYDIWQSYDGRARLNIIAGAGIGQGRVNETFQVDNDGDGIPETTEESSQVATIVPVIAGIGGDYYLHKNFALGVEASVNAPILVSVKDDGVDLADDFNASTQAIHGLLRITFVTGN